MSSTVACAKLAGEVMMILPMTMISVLSMILMVPMMMMMMMMIVGIVMVMVMVMSYDDVLRKWISLLRLLLL